MPAQTEAMLEKRGLWSWEPSWYGGLRQLLWPKSVALTVQAAMGVCAVATVIWLKFAGVSYEKRAALLPLLTLAALPYVLPADLLMIAPLVALRLADPRTPLPAYVLLLAVQTCAAVFFITSRLTAWPLYPATFSALVILAVADALRMNVSAFRSFLPFPGAGAARARDPALRG
jgi:hypothetical protein